MYAVPFIQSCHESRQGRSLILNLRTPLKQAIVIECGKLSQIFSDRTIVSGDGGLNSSSGSKANTLNIDLKIAGCDSYFRQ